MKNLRHKIQSEEARVENKPLNIDRHVAKIEAHQKEYPEFSDWWEKAAADWQAVRARGEALRSEHDRQAKIEAKARRVAAGIDGDHVYLLKLCANWPGQELAFLEAVEMTGNYDVRPWDDRNRPSCCCHINPPCSVCTDGDYWQDWRVGK